MRLPKPPSLEEVREHIPVISPVSPGEDRPFWSVMITTYNNGRFLRDALESVLAQDPGPEEMQIEVIDGGSTRDDPEPFIREISNGRVMFHRLLQNRGPAETFNSCIERSRGQWVHILHGDDLVCPHFYDEYAALARSYPDASMLVGQTIMVDERTRWTGLYGPLPPPGGGPLPDLLERLVTSQQVHFPGVVVRRRAYEEVGGFCILFKHVCDWDMWFRVALSGLVVCASQPYALYRRHNEADAIRQAISADDIREWSMLVPVNLARFGLERAVGARTWRQTLAASAGGTAWRLDAKGCLLGRLNQARWAWRLAPTISRLYMLAASWLKYSLSESAPGRRRKDATGNVP